MKDKEIFCFVNNKSVSLKVYALGKLRFEDEEKITIGRNDGIDVLFIKDGFGKILTNENEYPVCKNCSIILQKNKTAEIVSSKDLTVYLVSFEEENVEKIISGYLPFDQTVFDGQGTDILFEKAFSLQKESQVICAKNYPILPLILEMVFSAIKHTIFNVEISPVAKSTIEYLNANVSGKPSLDELSKKLELSKAQIIREFEKYYEISPYQYLINAKIELSANYLKYSDLSVKEIAKLLNFADEHYFSDTFKKKMNISPLKYRKSN